LLLYCCTRPSPLRSQREPRHEVEINDAEQAARIAELEAALLADIGLGVRPDKLCMACR